MKNKLQAKRLGIVPKRTLFIGTVLLFAAMACNTVFAYERYNDGCMECHGGFKDGTSTKGSIFPGDDKHRMHRSSSYMNTDCDLCHKSGDGDDPFIGSSDGTADNPGLGCNGCHNAWGLRAHHAINNVEDSDGFTCAECHDEDGTPPGEDVIPPYYGTVDTEVNNPCNDVLAANINENWTIGDFIGTDNDGDNLYDLADFDCGPAYDITAIAIEGGNVRITWNTVGGRRDILQSTDSLTNDFSDVGSALDIAGVGILSTNSVEVGGATALNRFYRIRYAP